MEQHRKDTIQGLFTPFILENIKILNNDELMREGKLSNFLLEDFRLIFTIEIDSKLRIIEFPFPFKIEKINEEICMSYNLNDFTQASAKTKSIQGDSFKSKLKGNTIKIIKQ